MKTLAAVLVCAAFVAGKKIPPKIPVPKVLPGYDDPNNTGESTKELPKDLLPEINFGKPDEEPRFIPEISTPPKVVPTTEKPEPTPSYVEPKPEKTKPKTPEVKPKPSPAADKTKPKPHKPEPEAEPVPETPKYEIPAADEEYWNSVSEKNFYYRNMWLGVFSGLYGMSSGVERPTDDCFGDWIEEKMVEVDFIKRKATEEGLWAISMEDASKVAYDSVDLVFLNDKYCHFRHTLYDVKYFCSQENSPCTMTTVMDNM